MARVHLAVGNHTAAVPWFRLLRDAPFRNQRAYIRLRVLMHLARGADVRLSRQDLSNWVSAAQRLHGPAARKQAARLHRLVVALGDAGKDQAVWNAVTGDVKPVPASAAWRGVRAIARAKKVGETVMLTLVGLVGCGEAPPPPLEAPPAGEESLAQLSARLSEPGGYFDTDNLISNETSYLHAVSDLDSLSIGDSAAAVGHRVDCGTRRRGRKGGGCSRGGRRRPTARRRREGASACRTRSGGARSGRRADRVVTFGIA